jgi:hydroxymethylglutaryl-CoA lyase
MSLFSALPDKVTLYEVGPRDGLQNEPRPVPTADKIAMINALSRSGLRHIEITSFVNPKWIPQLADASDVARGIARPDGVGFSCLVPNKKGLDAALAAGMREIALFMSASETHNKKNVNKTIAETLAAFEEVIPPARAKGLRVRGYVSTAWVCPYEGAVAPERVAPLAEQLLAMGCEQISLGDTIGAATPNQTRALVDRLLGRARPEQLALHMHDTRGTALANVLVGLEAGLTTFDASIGGLGGCPYAPGAAGNLATEDLVYMMHGMGYETGVDWPLLIAAGELAQRLVGRQLPGKALQAELARRTLLAGTTAS